MARTSKQSKKLDSYFARHQRLLNNVISDYGQNIASYNLFSTNEYSIFTSIQQGITMHPLRYYQMDALYLLDYIYSHSQSELKLKADLPSHRIKDFVNELLDDIEGDKTAPFLGYEMATGSGKTMLMGASIYFLNRKYGINNFLIITPASTDIYQKTIRNFEIGNFESVWADDTPFSFNLITGDNYTQNLFFNKEKEANIFIFNISKFGTNAKNTEKTWESAVWQDENGNNISIKQFLKDQKLVIITDEAHHAQTKVANKIIKNFHPLAVLEFTATAIESTTNLDKKNQTIIYKYDIRRFLEDGYGKLVRAVALASKQRQSKGQLNDNEKLKLITLLLIHLLKKESVLLDPKCRSVKPISFIKVNEATPFSKQVFDYVRNDLANDFDNINIILTKIRNQDLEITELLVTLFNVTYQGNIDILRKAIQRVADTTIFYHGKSDKETEKKFNNIRRNEVELVVYMHRLDEGIDLPNIFSIAVVNDSDTDFKTSVKQIIGRGVRLNKNKREFDDDNDYLRANSEKLHIVCDQGHNFEQVILAIQQEFGLGNKYLSFDKLKKPLINKAKSDLLDGKYIPHIKADFKAIDGVSLIDLIKDVNTITSKFLEDNCFEGENDTIKRYLKYKPDSFFLEVDVFSDKNVYHKQIQKGGGVATQLDIAEKDTKAIYGLVQKHLHCLPDSETSRIAFKEYMNKLNEFGLQYYRSDPADDKLALNLFVSAFSYFYRNHIEKNYFRLDFRQLQEEDSWNLKQKFRDYDIKIPEDQVENKTRVKIKEKSKIIELIDEQYHFFGYEKSIYDYEKFDSYTEYQLASYVNEILKQFPRKIEFQLSTVTESVPVVSEPNVGYETKNRNFWIRNQRNIWFTYGSKRYFPDFIVFRDGIVYIIEAKDEKFSDTKKNALLKKLEEFSGDQLIKGYKGLLIFSTQMDKMRREIWDFEKFIDESEETLKRKQSKSELVPDPPSEERYLKFIPVYSPDKAYKKFIKKQVTPKPDGWLEVERKTEKYPESIFATQVKGSSLLPDFDHNSWIIVNSNFEKADATGNLVLIHHPSIEDGYEGNFTIRNLLIQEKKSKQQLFPEKVIVLQSPNENTPTILIEGLSSEEEIQLIGIIYIHKSV